MVRFGKVEWCLERLAVSNFRQWSAKRVLRRPGHFLISWRVHDGARMELCRTVRSMDWFARELDDGGLRRVRGPVIPQRPFLFRFEAVVRRSLILRCIRDELRDVARTALDPSPGAGRLTLFVSDASNRLS